MNRARKIWGQSWIGGLLVGLFACLLVTATLDPSGSYPGLGQGPGVTVDEVFNAQQGVLLVELVKTYGVWILDPVIVRDVFGEGGDVPYLPDHPPLGRLLLGLGHHAMWAISSPESPEGISVTACARFGSAVMFGLTLFLIGATAGSWFGRAAGWFAPISVLLMPRVFAHAHLASLETSVGFTYSLAVLCLANQWSRQQAVQQIDADESSKEEKEVDQKVMFPTWKNALFPGAMLGLAMLTKIQGFLIVPPVILWALWNYRQKSLLPLFVWGVVGGFVFFFGWSWLWLDPIGHVRQFLGSATDRISLNLWYFGKVYADVDAPWHYPWVMFAVTVPAGLHLLGGLGAWKSLQRNRVESRMALVLMCIMFPLVLFSTKTAIYDGSRLFLMVYPLWGVFIGLGGKIAWDWLRERKSLRFTGIVMSFFFLTQCWGIYSMHPCQLSYYNLLTGGLRGANAIGLERTYWSDSISRDFLQKCAKEIPQNSIVEIGPVLHQFQLKEMETQSPIVRKKKWKLVPFTELKTSGEKKQYVIVYYRQADFPEEIKNHLESTKEIRPIVEMKREGVLLAALFRL